jgi:hypothetical protein
MRIRKKDVKQILECLIEVLGDDDVKVYRVDRPAPNYFVVEFTHGDGGSAATGSLGEVLTEIKRIYRE